MGLKLILKDRSFRIAIIMTFVFMSIGFAFLHFGLVTYGFWIFVALPIVVGLSIGALPHKSWSVLGMVISAICFLSCLYIIGLEGMLCIFMAFGWVVPLVFLGVTITFLFRRYRNLKATDNVGVIALPFVILVLLAPIDHHYLKLESINEMRSEIVLPYTPMEVYNATKHLDTLVGEKPFLMKLDLPVPQKCILEKEEVGAKRTCYFKGGRIIQEVKAIEPGKLMEMEVVEYELVGRKWLTFKDAAYYFEPIGKDSSKLIRLTSYTSELRPRIYWEPLEELGIAQEHEYVFQNLVRQLEIQD